MMLSGGEKNEYSTKEDWMWFFMFLFGKKFLR